MLLKSRLTLSAAEPTPCLKNRVHFVKPLLTQERGTDFHNHCFIEFVSTFTRMVRKRYLFIEIASMIISALIFMLMVILEHTQGK